MEWFWRKVDVLIAAVFVGGMAIAASQGHAFMTQYQERLARDLEQARARVDEIKTGLRYKLMSDVVRAELEATAQANFSELQLAYAAIAESFAVTRPFALARHREPRLIAETESAFIPRLPRDAGGMLFAVIGAMIGFLAYEIVKFPVALLVRPRQRKFRRRT